MTESESNSEIDRKLQQDHWAYVCECPNIVEKVRAGGYEVVELEEAPPDNFEDERNSYLIYDSKVLDHSVFDMSDPEFDRQSLGRAGWILIGEPQLGFCHAIRKK